MALVTQLAGSFFDREDVLSDNERRWLVIDQLDTVNQPRLIYERLLVLFSYAAATRETPENGFYRAALARFLRTARSDLIAAMWPNPKVKKIDLSYYSVPRKTWEIYMNHMCEEIFSEFNQLAPSLKLVQLIHAEVFDLCAELFEDYAERLNSDLEDEEEEEEVTACSTCPKCRKARTVSKKRVKPMRRRKS